MQYHTAIHTRSKSVAVMSWLLALLNPARSRQVTDIRELSTYLRDDIGARDAYHPRFR